MLALRGENERIRYDKRARAWSVWHGAVLPNARPLPSIAELAGETDGSVQSEPQSPDKMLFEARLLNAFFRSGMRRRPNVPA